MTMKTSKEQRKQLERENRSYPLSLVQLPRDEWLHLAINRMIEVWRSRHFLVQIFQECDNVIRLTVCRTAHSGADWQAEISWDTLQRLKRECGFADEFAVEIFPAEIDLVNVANMRHLWVLPEPPPFAWRRA